MPFLHPCPRAEVVCFQLAKPAIFLHRPTSAVHQLSSHKSYVSLQYLDQITLSHDVALVHYIDDIMLIREVAMIPNLLVRHLYVRG